MVDHLRRRSRRVAFRPFLVAASVVLVAATAQGTIGSSSRADDTAGGGPYESRQVAASARPNILLIVTDDQREGTVRPQIMPHTHRALVEKRLPLHSNSFVTNAWCCPSRASILTGQYSHTNGVWTVGGPYGHEGVARPRGVDAGDVVARRGLPDRHRRQVPQRVRRRPHPRLHAARLGHDRDHDQPRLPGEPRLLRLPTSSRTASSSTTGTGPERLLDPRLHAEGQELHRSGRRPTLVPVPRLHLAARSADLRPPGRGCRARPLLPEAGERLREGRVGQACRFVRRAKPCTLSHKQFDRRMRGQQARMLASVDRGLGRIFDDLKASGQLHNTLILLISDNGSPAGEPPPERQGAPLRGVGPRPTADEVGRPAQGATVHRRVRAEHRPGTHDHGRRGGG